MQSILETLVVGTASFAATNVDDLFVLMLFFNQAQAEGESPWPIVLGQYLGFGVLVGVSTVGQLLHSRVDEPWIGLLGFVPLWLGVRAWYRQRRRTAARTEAAVGRAASWGGSVLSVAVVTIANGGDNLGVYIPLFARSDPLQVGFLLLGFAVLVGAWCGLARWLGTHPAVAWTLQRRSARHVPWLFIGLGLYLLLGSGVWRLFG